jgi:hypothetical protein
MKYVWPRIKLIATGFSVFTVMSSMTNTSSLSASLPDYDFFEVLANVDAIT